MVERDPGCPGHRAPGQWGRRDASLGGRGAWAESGSMPDSPLTVKGMCRILVFRLGGVWYEILSKVVDRGYRY